MSGECELCGSTEEVRGGPFDGVEMDLCERCELDTETHSLRVTVRMFREHSDFMYALNAEPTPDELARLDEIAARGLAAQREAFAAERRSLLARIEGGGDS